MTAVVTRISGLAGCVRSNGWLVVGLALAAAAAGSVALAGDGSPGDGAPRIPRRAPWIQAGDGRFTDHADAEWDQRRSEIEAELATLGSGHDWAGIYSDGSDDSFGSQVLELAPKSGFVYRAGGEWGLMDQNFGAVALEGDHVVVTPILRGRDPTRSPLLAQRYALVRWGERRYLVEAARLPAFANHVNSGFEPHRIIRPEELWRQGNQTKGVSGLPTGPPELLAMLRSQPLEAAVTRVLDQRIEHAWSSDGSVDLGERRISRLELGVGSDQAVWRGMRLWVVDPDIAEAAMVVDVGPSTATIVVTQQDPSHHPPPAVGWRLSTRNKDALSPGIGSASPDAAD